MGVTAQLNPDTSSVGTPIKNFLVEQNPKASRGQVGENIERRSKQQAIREVLGQFCKETWKEAERKEQETTAPKPKHKRHPNQHTKHKQLRIDGIVSSRYTRPLSGIWQNERVPMTVRVDKKLKKAFKLKSMAYAGSTCRVLEGLMAGFVGATNLAENSSVYPPLTVDIGTIKIERNIRSRRKMVVETETEESVTVLKCGFRGCGNEAVGKALFVQRNEEFLLCSVHLAEARANRLLWRVLS